MNNSNARKSAPNADKRGRIAALAREARAALISAYERARAYIASNSKEAFGALLAFLIMLVHPLAYQDYFFNINRFKFYIYIASAFTGLVIYLALSLYAGGGGIVDGAGGEGVAGVARKKRRLTLADAGMFAFVCASILSCAASASPEQAITGSQGRFSGLILILAMCAVYIVVSRAPRAREALLAGLLISGEACALLGILNFFRIDPLGFYARLSVENSYLFISTIGNIDFFGAFLCLFLPAAVTLSLRAKACWVRAFSRVCALTGVMAAAAARADVAMIAPIICVFACALTAVESRRCLARALTALCALLSGIALMGALEDSFESMGFSSSMACEPLLSNYIIVGALALALGVAALALRLARDARTPFKHNRALKKWLWRAPFILLVALVLTMVYFSAIDTVTPLKGALRYLRFGDLWGTNRGGVWIRCLKLYASSDVGNMLLGYGPDMLKTPLYEAYGAEIAAYSGLSFDNAHNEYIQYLLTLGALGLGAYILFVAACLKRLARAAKQSPAAAACLAAACAYLIQAIFNVNQPETTPLVMLTLYACANVDARPQPFSRAE